MWRSSAPGPSAEAGAAAPGFRYAGVFLLTLLLLVFEVLRPADDWARAVTVALQCGAVTVVAATSRVAGPTRRARTLTFAAGAFVVVVGIATGAISDGAGALISGALSAAIPILLCRGLLRLVRDHGATPQAVAGGLAIYLSVGLVFSWAIGVVAAVGDAPYFAEGTDGSPGDRVYFSFATLTTTGYGDFTPAAGVGHALAVLEMLVGQLYLVTVVGVLVGRVVTSRPRA